MTTPAPAPRRPVAAVIIDGPEAAAVARRAAAVAAEEYRPVLLLVPVLRSDFTGDTVIAAHVHQQAVREAQAIAARARPALEAAGVPVQLQIVWHRACPFRRAYQARAIALAHAARAAGAALLVTPADLPVPAVLHGPEGLLVAGGRFTVTVRRPARTRKLVDL